MTIYADVHVRATEASQRDAARDIHRTFEKAGRDAGRSFGDEFGRGLSSGHMQAGMRQITTAVDQVTVSTDKATKSTERFADAQGKLRDAQGRFTSDNDSLVRSLGNTADAFGAATDQVAKMGTTFSGVMKFMTPVALGAAIPVLVTLGGVAASAAEGIALLPGAATAAAAGIGTLAFATMGFSDAIKEIRDPEKFAEAIAKLSPNAAAAANSLQRLLPVFDQIQHSASDAFFTGMGQRFEQMATTFGPSIQTLTTGIASAFNQAFMGITDTLMLPDMQNSINAAIGNIVTAFEQLAPAAAPLTQALGDLMEVGSSFLPDLAEGAADAAQAFADFIREAKDSGKLREWIGNGLDTMGQLAGIAWDLGEAFMALAPIGQEELPKIAQETKNIADAMVGLLDMLNRVSDVLSIIKDTVNLVANPLKGIMGFAERAGIVNQPPPGRDFSGGSFGAPGMRPIMPPIRPGRIAGLGQGQYRDRYGKIRPIPPRPDQIPQPLGGPYGSGGQESTKERRDRIRAGLNPGDFAVDPFAPIGGGPGMGIGAPGANWDAIAQKESSGQWNLPYGDRDSTGGLQIRQGTWDMFGGQQYAPQPWQATKEQQIAIGEKILAAQGPQAWAGGKNFVPASPGMGMGAFGGDPRTSGYAGLVPAAKNLEQILRQQFPMLGAIGGQQNRPAGTPQGHTKGLALDINIPGWDTPQGNALGDQINAWLQANMGSLGLQNTIWENIGREAGGGTFTSAGHMNHIHAQIAAAMAGGTGMSPMGMGMGMGGPGGYYQVDQQAVTAAQHDVQRDAYDLQNSRMDLAVLEQDTLATEREIQDAKQKVIEDEWALQESQARLAEAQQGTWESMDSSAQSFSAGMQQVGAQLDADFGASKGLAGLAENLTKFLANLAFAPMLGALGAVSAATGANQPGAGSGLMGMIGQAAGMGQPGGMGAGAPGMGFGAGLPQLGLGTGAGFGAGPGVGMGAGMGVGGQGLLGMAGQAAMGPQGLGGALGGPQAGSPASGMGMGPAPGPGGAGIAPAGFQSSMIPGQPSTPPQGTGSGTSGIGGLPLSAAMTAASGLDLLAPGAGMAAQVGIQLANRTIAYGGQVAGILASGLLETGTLSSSGPMTDPLKTLPGRLIAGFAGARPALPNMAGGGQGQAGQAQTDPNKQGKGGSGVGGSGQAGPLVAIENYNANKGEQAAGRDIGREMRSQEVSAGFAR